MSEEQNPVVRQAKPVDPKAKKRQENILLILLIIIVAGVLFVLYRSGVIGGGASEKPVETYLNAICSRDFDGFISTMPQKIAADHISDRDELGLDGSEYMSRLYADYFGEFGDDMSVKAEFTGRSRPDKVYIDNFRQSYLEIYGEEIRFSSVFEIDVSAVFSGSKSSSEVDLEFYVIKTSDGWKVVGADYPTNPAEE